MEEPQEALAQIVDVDTEELAAVALLIFVLEQIVYMHV